LVAAILHSADDARDRFEPAEPLPRRLRCGEPPSRFVARCRASFLLLRSDELL